MEGIWRCVNGRLMKKSLGLFFETIGESQSKRESQTKSRFIDWRHRMKTKLKLFSLF